MRKEGILTQIEAERLLAFTNNSGPLFIIGTVGISLFGSSTIGILLFITHLLACITVGILFRFWKYQPELEKNNVSTSIKIEKEPPQWDLLSSSIMNSIHTVVLIGGFVVLFSVIISILQHSGFLLACSHLLEPICHLFHININFCIPFLSGIVELTNGVSAISMVADKSISINIILCAFLLGFAGISVLLQVYSIIAKSDISIKPYILGKLLHGVFAALYTYLIIKNVSFFNFDLEPVFAIESVSYHTNLISHYLNYYNIFLFGILFLLVIILYLKSRRHKKSHDIKRRCFYG